MIKLIYYVIVFVERLKIEVISRYYKKILDIHESVRMGRVEMDKMNISIGEGSYIRSGEIASGEGKVNIGKYCAIGSNVTIRARSHDLKAPTASSKLKRNKRVYGDINIGDHVWIGNNAVIKHGVRVGSHAVIGANSVVTKDVPENFIVAGAPAKVIRENKILEKSLY